MVLGETTHPVILGFEFPHDPHQGEVDRLTAEVDRLSFEAVSKQPALKQIGIELELERGKRQELAQVWDL